MPEPIDVGSVLGGRYKVTGRILASAENDVILDGLDQTLNRPVSILVSSPENSANLSQSARDVATGERASNVSILDLGSADGSTYLITSRSSPADLLDLVVPTEAVEQPVYEEPFFTDTLGTEIFGTSRAQAPVSGAYVYEDNSPLTPASSPAVLPPVQPVQPAPPVQPAQPVAPVPPPTPSAPTAPSAPKVSLWDDDDYGFINEDHESSTSSDRAASKFPAAALAGYEATASASTNGTSNAEDGLYDAGEDEDNSPRKSGRWLTGIIVTVLVVGALVFALSHIGNLLSNTPLAGNSSPGTTAAPQSPAASPAAPTAAPPVVVAPAIAAVTDITAYAPGAVRYDDVFIPRLKDTFDDNKGTYWPTVEFSDQNFAQLVSSIDLAVELKQEATISSVTITQIAGTGGQFNILTNSKPSLDGAKKIGNGSFTGPEFNQKYPAGITAKYVIVSFTQLPRLQPFVTYPFGLKIAEISVK